MLLMTKIPKRKQVRLLKKSCGTLHWVSLQHAIEAEVRLYDRLFTDEAPDSHKEKIFLNLEIPILL
jgi:glutaminyl-tRNA synthetase